MYQYVSQIPEKEFLPISWTRYSLIQECQARWCFRYVEQKEVHNASIRFLFGRGKQNHLAAQKPIEQQHLTCRRLDFEVPIAIKADQTFQGVPVYFVATIDYIAYYDNPHTNKLRVVVGEIKSSTFAMWEKSLPQLEFYLALLEQYLSGLSNLEFEKILYVHNKKESGVVFSHRKGFRPTVTGSIKNPFCAVWPEHDKVLTNICDYYLSHLPTNGKIDNTPKKACGTCAVQKECRDVLQIQNVS
jgi:hypothetical protein